MTPDVQLLRVSDGGFGRALEGSMKQENIPDVAARLLKSSSTFMATARTLDHHYVWRGDSFRFVPEYDQNGRIVRGGNGIPQNMVGKRELEIEKNTDGAMFIPRSSIENPYNIDLILFESTNVAGFVQQIVHEATHAKNSVTGSAAPAPLVDFVHNRIDEEISVREEEAKVLKEIPIGRVGGKFEPVGSTLPRDVERDFVPGVGLTYLEAFFFDWRLREAKRAEGLSDDEAEQIRKQVDSKRTPQFIFTPRNDPATGLADVSQYAETWFNRRQAQREWKEFHRIHFPTNRGFQAARKILLEPHAADFFEGRIKYRP